ncbi:UNVERIFIED_CONTAM: hypothetical protein GTU68_038069 [Idotea baltica]|nr:hypothetical protein [Idotea baltica]
MGLGGSGLFFRKNPKENQSDYKLYHEQRFNMHGYAAPKIDTVRIGLIGIGERGTGTVRRLAGIQGVDIKALCDLVPQRVEDSIKSLREEFPKYNPETYTENESSWKKVCERDDIDLIYTATPWNLHAEIAIYAMEQGKHVYTELPVGLTIEECWKVVEASERTKKHVFMESGSCHEGMAATILNMSRHGVFGDIVHGEGTYIHDRVSNDKVRWTRDPQNSNWFGYRPWRLQENHGLGPVSQIMDLNYGDAMDYMVSISSDDFTMAPKMEQIAQQDAYFKPYVGLNFRGNMNTSIIRTKRGRTIMLQHDISSPRPNVRFNLISGTNGVFQSYPRPAQFANHHDGWMPEEEFESLLEKYEPTITKTFNQKKKDASHDSSGGSYHNVTSTDWRLIDCLRNGLPIEMDVYDAALWSVISPLSEASVAREGASVKVPDFTSGSWKTNKRGMDISLEKGGNTGLF